MSTLVHDKPITDSDIHAAITLRQSAQTVDHPSAPVPLRASPYHPPSLAAAMVASVGAVRITRPDVPNRGRPAIAAAMRTAAATLLLIPCALLVLRLGQPFAISTMASTAAVVLHSPNRYRRRPHVIATCYAAGLAITVPITLAGTVGSMSWLLASTIAAVVIVASPVGRIHPPTACIPLAITTSSSSAALLTGWVMFAGVAAGFLAALWMIVTLAARRRR